MSVKYIDNFTCPEPMVTKQIQTLRVLFKSIETQTSIQQY